jgi:hypothetical protein
MGRITGNVEEDSLEETVEFGANAVDPRELPSPALSVSQK